MWRCDNVGGLGEHVKKHVLRFFRYTFFNFLVFFCFILWLTPSAQKWTDFDNLYAQGCAFWCLVHTAPHFGSKVPQKPLFWGRE